MIPDENKFGLLGSYPFNASLPVAVNMPDCSGISYVSIGSDNFHRVLDDQTQVDSKPAGHPEHASLNQC